MKIVAISDTHTQQLPLPESDVLIHAGDFSARGTYEEYLQFLTWMAKIRHNYKRILVTPGNHDIFVYKNEVLAKEDAQSIGIDLLIDSGLEIDGVKFYGYPWTPVFFDWAYMCEDLKRQKHVDAIPKTDVLISHGPVKWHLDKVRGQNVGCELLLNALTRIKPKILTCGHIHEGYGTALYQNTEILNVAVLDERYRLRNKPTLFES